MSLIDSKKFSKNNLQDIAIEALKNEGAIMIRNLFNKEIINIINKKWKIFFSEP